jgi:ribokinase
LLVGHLLVIGSVNADLVVRVDDRPRPGETVRGGPLAVLSGGKGANQAVAARLMGADVSLVGAVGSDANAAVALRELERHGVDLSRLRALETATGTAVIVLTPDGENQIIVRAGANDVVGPEHGTAAIEGAPAGTVVLLQLELPLDTVRQSVIAAHARGLRVVLNAAPVALLDDVVLRACDPLVVNETEAAKLLGVPHLGGDVTGTMQRLRGLGPRSVVLTLGAAGCAWATADGVGSIAAPVVDAVDTTGAGDAFVGSMCAAICAGMPLDRAAERGVVAGAIAVQRTGAQASYPTKGELESWMEASHT